MKGGGSYTCEMATYLNGESWHLPTSRFQQYLLCSWPPPCSSATHLTTGVFPDWICPTISATFELQNPPHVASQSDSCFQTYSSSSICGALHSRSVQRE